MQNEPVEVRPARGAKMGEFAALTDSFRRQAERSSALDDLCLWDVEQQDLPGLSGEFWEIIAHLQVGIGRTKIVAGSKALHHLLPDPLLPIDRSLVFFASLHRRPSAVGCVFALKSCFGYRVKERKPK
jgi:hypothetical protein